MLHSLAKAMHGKDTICMASYITVTWRLNLYRLMHGLLHYSNKKAEPIPSRALLVCEMYDVRPTCATQIPHPLNGNYFTHHALKNDH